MLVILWAVFSLGRIVVGPRHAALAVLLMAGIAAFSVPTPEFGPALLATALWALILLHYWRAVGQGRRIYWLAVGFEAGLLLLTDLFRADADRPAARFRIDRASAAASSSPGPSPISAAPS